MSVSVKSVIRMTPSIRKRASMNIWAHKEESFDMDFLFHSLRHLVEENEQSKHEKSFIQQMRMIDLTKFIRDAQGLNQYFTCSFFSKRFAWISKNEQGEYRYFSKIKDGHGYYAFDLFDLMTIVLNKSNRELALYMEETFSITGIDEWVVREKKKIEENIDMLSNVSLMETPNLQMVLRGGVDVLKRFLMYAKEHISGKHLATGGNAVFFLSTQYVKDHFFPKKSVSTLNQWVNLFAVLGLVEKPKQVPIEMQVEAEKHQALKKKHNHVSFYCFPVFSSVFSKAEKRAKELVKRRISYHQVTKEMVRSLFGKEVHDDVYVQRTHGRKKSIPVFEKNRAIKSLSETFRIQLQERGVVSKRELESQSSLPKSVFTRTWNDLVLRHDCESGQATLEERERLGLRPRQTVARRIEHTVGSTTWKTTNALPWDDEDFHTLFPDERASFIEVS